MSYRVMEQTYERIELDAGGPIAVTVAGSFGIAFSLIATISFDEATSDSAKRLNWWLRTGVTGNDWGALLASVPDFLGKSVYPDVGTEDTATVRILGPFGEHLGRQL